MLPEGVHAIILLVLKLYCRLGAQKHCARLALDALLQHQDGQLDRDRDGTRALKEVELEIVWSVELEELKLEVGILRFVGDLGQRARREEPVVRV